MKGFKTFPEMRQRWKGPYEIVTDRTLLDGRIPAELMGKLGSVLEVRFYGKRTWLRLLAEGDLQLMTGWDARGNLADWTVSTDTLGSLTDEESEGDDGARMVPEDRRLLQVYGIAQVLHDENMIKAYRAFLLPEEMSDDPYAGTTCVKGGRADIAAALYAAWWELRDDDPNYAVTAKSNNALASFELHRLKLEFLSAILGEPKAIREVAWTLDNGWEEMGIKADSDLGAWWYERAAELGEAMSQNNLANYYHSSEAPKHSCKKAIHWWRKAAEQGLPTAMRGLATCFGCVYGPNDSAQAEAWARKADETEKQQEK